MHLLNIIFAIFLVVISSQRRKSLTKKKTRDIEDNYTCEGGVKGDTCDLLTNIRIFIDAGSSGTRFYPEANLNCNVKDDSLKDVAYKDKKTTLKFLFTKNTDAKGVNSFDTTKAENFKTNFLR